MTCAFCNDLTIHKREVAANKLARAFLGRMPIVPGHTLVIPKRCVSKYEDLTGDEKQAVEDLRSQICDALKRTFDAEGLNFAWNDGEVAGQTVPHFHLHIVPRKEGDTGIYKYEPREFLYRPGVRGENPSEELQKVASLVRKSIVE